MPTKPTINHSPKGISVKGARVNNLKNVDVFIPRNKLVVVTGVSGSGKSSLAFDTLYAEGQRRYVESLSTYARQFMGKLSKPETDGIKGLPPAIAIEQKVNTRNPRSTVGTSTEIYDYLRLLFARIGRTYSPITGKEVKIHTTDDVMAAALAYPEGTPIALVTDINIKPGRKLSDALKTYMKEGFARIIDPDGKFVSIAKALDDEQTDNVPEHHYSLVVDRLAVSSEQSERTRLADSIETAFHEGWDRLTLIAWVDGKVERQEFSKYFEADGMRLSEPNEQMFNFNSSLGACRRCNGLGNDMGISEELVVPLPTLSVYEGAVMPWRGEKMSLWQREFIHLAPKWGFPIHRPYNELTPEQKSLLWHGNSEFGGIDGFFEMVQNNLHKIQYRVMLARYRGLTTCPECHGSRLAPQALYVKINGKSINQLVEMPVTDLLHWINNLELSQTEQKVAKRLLAEITSRLNFLNDVGLGYLSLNRPSSTLSGGESQRINLATSLGSSLVGSLYILDEPSIGLHSRDTQRLINVIRKLQSIGNTVVVVEHDEEIMRTADYIIDVGPDAGSNGGNIIYQGDINGISNAANSYTASYLNGSLSIPVPKHRRRSSSYIEVQGACANNLKNIDVKFPLGVMTVVTGVSGSGKSTLVNDILYRALGRELEQTVPAPGSFKALSGDIKRIRSVEFVDQNPIGKSTRSNPATYLKAYDEIRKLYSEQQESKVMGFTPAYFSFNTEGGRCENCKGEGTITIEMQFMADITVTCEECHGQRFNRDVLNVRYRGKNINDVLNLTIDEAIEFFDQDNDSTAKRIVRRLMPLKDVGLGYIKLGQPSSTLSGGENQRVKLAYFLSEEKQQPSMFIFDEPTTGLHFRDIQTLMESFNRLIANGHTIVIIEHNLDVIKCADHIIDIGPEGGAEGGRIVAQGTPEQVAECAESYTGQYLREKLKQ